MGDRLPWADIDRILKNAAHCACGCAVAIAEVIDCRPMTKRDEVAAQCEVYPNAFAWVLANVRPITPFPVKGRLGLYEVEFPQRTDSRMPLFEREGDR